MSHQRKLFVAEERKERDEKKREEALEAKRAAKQRQREIEREREKFRELNKQPKAEFYQCECGLLLHWRVAFGHRSGCPQCHKPIPRSEIFE